jgi:hypothetical protein
MTPVNYLKAKECRIRKADRNLQTRRTLLPRMEGGPSYVSAEGSGSDAKCPLRYGLH